MKHARNFLVIFIMLTGICWAGATTEYSWVSVGQPFQETIKIPLYGQASLDVNIPIEYLEGEKFLTFRMFLDTPFRIIDSPGETSGFAGFAPTVRVNDSKFSGVYPFRFKYKMGETYSEAFVKIKTKHLKAGRNNLTFSAGKDDSNYFWSCGGNRTNCTAIFIHKLWLDR